MNDGKAVSGSRTGSGEGVSGANGNARYTLRGSRTRADRIDGNAGATAPTVLAPGGHTVMLNELFGMGAASAPKNDTVAVRVFGSARITV